MDWLPSATLFRRRGWMRTVYLVLKCFKKKRLVTFFEHSSAFDLDKYEKKNEPAVFRFWFVFFLVAAIRCLCFLWLRFFFFIDPLIRQQCRLCFQYCFFFWSSFFSLLFFVFFLFRWPVFLLMLLCSLSVCCLDLMLCDSDVNDSKTVLENGVSLYCVYVCASPFLCYVSPVLFLLSLLYSGVQSLLF